MNQWLREHHSYWNYGVQYIWLSTGLPLNCTPPHLHLHHHLLWIWHSTTHHLQKKFNLDIDDMVVGKFAQFEADASAKLDYVMNSLRDQYYGDSNNAMSKRILDATKDANLL